MMKSASSSQRILVMAARNKKYLYRSDTATTTNNKRRRRMSSSSSSSSSTASSLSTSSSSFLVSIIICVLVTFCYQDNKSCHHHHSSSLLLMGVRGLSIPTVSHTTMQTIRNQQQQQHASSIRIPTETHLSTAVGATTTTTTTRSRRWRRLQKKTYYYRRNHHHHHHHHYHPISASAIFSSLSSDTINDNNNNNNSNATFSSAGAGNYSSPAADNDSTLSSSSSSPSSSSTIATKASASSSSSSISSSTNDDIDDDTEEKEESITNIDDHQNRDANSSTNSATTSRWKRRMVEFVTGQTITTSTTIASVPSLRRPKCLENVIRNNSSSSSSRNNPNASMLSKLVSKFISSVPGWMFHLRSSVQLVLTVIVYVFHTVVLTQRFVAFPFQLIPNDRGYFTSIGYDSLLGIVTLLVYQYIRRHQTVTQDENAQEEEDEEPTSASSSSSSSSLLPSLLSKPDSLDDMPWKNIWKSKYSRITSAVTFGLLLYGYYYTKYASMFWEDKLYEIGRYAHWMTVPMHHSLTILLGHSSWVVFASLILRWIPRPQPYFNYIYEGGTGQPSMWFTSQFSRSSTRRYTNKDDDNDDRISMEESSIRRCAQQQEPEQTQWMWWVLGGYFVSFWLFQIADWVNMYVFPIEFLESVHENDVVSKIVNSNERWASVVGFVAPCITAPWFEEILYRGFLLPTVLLWMPSSVRLPTILLPTIAAAATASNKNATTEQKTNNDNNNDNPKFFSRILRSIARLRIRKTYISISDYHLAVFVSSVLFSAHHQQTLAFLPLCVLGSLWSIVYTKSQNLWTTILIHSMWNSRVFFGGWFGL